MILISHRGNISGPNPECENEPNYLIEALDKGFGIESDVWFLDNNRWYFGHDHPQYPVVMHKFIEKAGTRALFHCKNPAAINEFKRTFPFVDFFWHENDRFALTSHNQIIIHPKAPLIPGGICMMPECREDSIGLDQCVGACSDYVGELWNCCRCNQIVDMSIKRCGCEASPSPWELIK